MTSLPNSSFSQSSSARPTIADPPDLKRDMLSATAAQLSSMAVSGSPSCLGKPSKPTHSDWSKIEYVAPGAEDAAKYWEKSTMRLMHNLRKELTDSMEKEEFEYVERHRWPNSYYSLLTKDPKWGPMVRVLTYSRLLREHHRPFHWKLLTPEQPSASTYQHTYLCVPLPSILSRAQMFRLMTRIGGQVVELQVNSSTAPVESCYVRFATTDPAHLVETVDMTKEIVPLLLTSSNEAHVYDDKLAVVVRHNLRVRSKWGNPITSKGNKQPFKSGHVHKVRRLGDKLCIVLEDEQDYGALMGTEVLEGSDLGKWKEYKAWPDNFHHLRLRIATVQEVHPTLKNLDLLQPSAFQQQSMYSEKASRWSSVSLLRMEGDTKEARRAAQSEAESSGSSGGEN